MGARKKVPGAGAKAVTGHSRGSGVRLAGARHKSSRPFVVSHRLDVLPRTSDAEVQEGRSYAERRDEEDEEERERA